MSARRCRTRAPRCTSPGTRSTPTTWSAARRTSCTHTPCRSPHAHARVTAARRRRRRSTCPGVVRVLTAEDVPGVNDAGIKHDEPLFPDRGHVPRAPGLLGARRDAGGGPARGRRGRGGVRAAAGPHHGPRGDRGRELPGRPAARWSAATSTRGAGRRGPRLRGRDRVRRAGALLPRDPLPRSRTSTRPARSSCSAAPSTRPRPRRSSPTCSACPATRSPCSACGWAAASAARRCSRTGSRRSPRSGATLTGRPVRLRLNRTQDMTMTGKRHGFHAAWRVGFDDDGRLPALDATLTSDGGWSLDLSEPVLARALCHIDNAYWIPDVRVNGRIAQDQQDLADGVPRVRRAAGDARDRGHPRPVRAAARASTRRRCAGATSTSRARRRRTASRSGTPSGWSPPGTRSRAGRRSTARRGDRRVQRGARRTPSAASAITPVKFGISFNFTAFNQAGALVHVYKDGSVLINHGGTEMGQGLHTKMLQVAATALGLPLEKVRLAPTRTDKVPNTSATAASVGRRPQRRRGQERLRADPAPGLVPVRADRSRRRAARRRRWDELVRRGVPPADPALGGRLLQDRGAQLGRRRR